MNSPIFILQLSNQIFQLFQVSAIIKNDHPYELNIEDQLIIQVYVSFHHEYLRY